MRIRIILKCGGCKNNNYIISKNKSSSVGKPITKKYKKYCKFCRTRLYHNEEKMK